MSFVKNIFFKFGKKTGGGEKMNKKEKNNMINAIASSGGFHEIKEGGEGEGRIKSPFLDENFQDKKE